MVNKLAYASDELIDYAGAAADNDDQIELPDVTGWRILVHPLEVKERTAGGIILPEAAIDRESLVVTVGRVIQLGPLAYKRDDMGEPWCAVGDLVGFGKYSGKRCLHKGYNFIILNDDEILMIMPSRQF